MAYVALIGLYFVPILCLLGAGWSYVRWKNEHEDEALSERAHKNCRRFLIAIPHRCGGVPGPEIHIPRGLTHKKVPRAQARGAFLWLTKKFPLCT